MISEINPLHTPPGRNTVYILVHSFKTIITTCSMYTSWGWPKDQSNLRDEK